MEPLKRLQKAIEILQKLNPTDTLKIMSHTMGYAATGYLSNVLSGSKPITKKFLARLERYYLVSAHWIETGEGQELIDPTEHFKDDLPENIKGRERALFKLICYDLAELHAKIENRPFSDCLKEIYGKVHLIWK